MSKKESFPTGSSAEHTRLIKEIILRIGSKPWARVWRNETGMGLNVRTGEPFKYGLVGSPDIVGLTLGGYYIGIEVKTGSATQAVAQKNFQKMVESLGGIYLLGRSAEQVEGDLVNELKRREVFIGDEFILSD